VNTADKLQIHELLARTTFGLDQRDPGMIEACFSKDAVFELEIKGTEVIPPFVGRKAIMKLMTDTMNSHGEDRRHVVSNIFFESEADNEASVVSSLVAFQAEHGKIGVMTSGIYRDRVIKVHDDWKISVRRLSLDVPF